jgi:hypothetical protein
MHVTILFPIKCICMLSYDFPNKLLFGLLGWISLCLHVLLFSKVLVEVFAVMGFL